MKSFLVVFTFLFSTSLFAQEEVSIQNEQLTLYGTLTTPKKGTEKAVLIISGSGATDRNGNTTPLGYVNNSLKQLAEQLALEGYATLRYDKRGVGKSIDTSITPENLRFEQYMIDAEKWALFLKERYSKVFVLGHSQGGLIGMVATKNAKADAFISLAGLTEGAYSTVKKQLASQPQFVKDAAFPILDNLNQGVKTDSVPPYLHSFLHPKIQDYFMSFMNYDPREEIKKIHIPILIVQGTLDLQITVEGARSLATYNPISKIEIIKGMNHVLKQSSENAAENLGTYSNPNLALHPDLVPIIAKFLAQVSSK